MSVEDATASDATCARLLASLRSELGDKVLAAEIQRNEIVVRVPREAWVAAARACRRTLGMDYFCFLSGLDWLDSPTQTSRYENVWGSVDEDEGAEEAEAADANADAGGGEPVAAAESADAGPTLVARGLAGGDSRFQVFARFASTRDHRGITVKADVDDTDPSIATISKIYAGADWHERETWEMYGVRFEGHPHLIHIYLPGAFEGFPLRKDFPLLAREVKPWPGLTNVEAIAGEAAAEEGSEG